MSAYSNWTTRPQRVLPSAAAGVSVTPNATAFNNSSWVELTTGFSFPIIIVGVSVNNAAVVAEYRVDLGSGAASSEVVIGTLMNSIESDVGFDFLEFRIPVFLAANTRLSVRLRKSGTSVTPWLFKIAYFEVDPLNVAHASAVPYMGTQYLKIQRRF